MNWDFIIGLGLLVVGCAISALLIAREERRDRAENWMHQ